MEELVGGEQLTLLSMVAVAAGAVKKPDPVYVLPAPSAPGINDRVPWVRTLGESVQMVPPEMIEGDAGKNRTGLWADELIGSADLLAWHWKNPGWRPSGPRAEVVGHAWAVAAVRKPTRAGIAGRGVLVGPFASPEECRTWWTERAGRFRSEVPLWAPVQVWYLLPPDDPDRLIGGRPWREVDRDRPPMGGGDPREYINGMTGEPWEQQPWLEKALRRDVLPKAER